MENGNQPENKSEEKPEEKGTNQFLKQIEATAARIEEANANTARLLQEQKELEALRRLGGETGGASQEVKKEETPAEYAKKVLRGEIK